MAMGNQGKTNEKDMQVNDDLKNLKSLYVLLGLLYYYS